MIIKWDQQKSPDFQKMSEESIAVIVVGSLEQHAKHLPTGTDVMLGMAVAQASAMYSDKQILILPPVAYGFSAHHMDFPGSITLRQSTLTAILEDIGDGIICTGLRNVVFFVSHGGNSAAVHTALNELGIRHEQGNFVLLRYWDFIKEYMQNLRESPQGGIGHAGEMETSMMMYLYPELVNDNWEDYELARGNEWHHPDMFAANRVTTYRKFSSISPYGNVGVCDKASAAKGKQLLNQLTCEIGTFFDGYFKGKNQDDTIK